MVLPWWNAMGSLADRIEAHIMRLLAHSDEGYVEVRRYELAHLFDCVPSQVTYVLSTRFTPDRGFIVESRRGGGGYIRIVARHPRPERERLARAWRRIGQALTEAEAEGLLDWLERTGVATCRQTTVARQVLRQEAAQLEPPLDGVMRAALLKGMLVVLAEGRGGSEDIR